MLLRRLALIGFLPLGSPDARWRRQDHSDQQCQDPLFHGSSFFALLRAWTKE
jgi:hypothetical protein